MKRPVKWLLSSLALIFLALAFGLGWWLSSTPAQISSHKARKQKPIYWVAPMNPKFRRDKPGKSPMGMDLVPVYSEPDQAGTVKISPAVENNLGVRTALVKRRHFQKQIKTVGYVTPNESTLQAISVYTDGWIKNLQINATGEPVKRHQLLFKLYSPSLISAQEEYLLALKYKNKRLTQAGKQKLSTLGMSLNDIDQLTQQRQAEQAVSIYAPQSGYVTQLQARDGQHVKPGTPLMSIAKLSTVWVIAEVYEQQAIFLKVGQAVQARFPYLPKNTTRGKINYIYPTMNEKTRTVRVRLVFANPDNKLKPGMYANIIIDGGQSQPVITIPKSALIQLGNSDRVVLALGHGRFKSISVKVGQQNKDWIEITKGLKPGEKVVTSAQFLLDSESSLKAGLSRLDTNGAKTQSKSNMATPMMSHDHMNH